MIPTRKARRDTGSGASFCHVVLPRSERREGASPGSRAHTVYLVRLLSDLGSYPSADSWYELRYSRLTALHTSLRASHPLLALPWLPRSRWLGNQSPTYVAQMVEDLLKYLRSLLVNWEAAYGSFEGFIMMLDSLHHGERMN